MKNEKAGLGTMTIEPSEPVEAGRTGTWTLTYTAGEAGIAAGGGFRIMPPVTEPGNHYMLVRWQLNAVSASGPEDGEVSAEIVELNRGRYDGAYAYIIEVKNLGRALKVGEQISVTLKHAVASRFAMPGGRFEVEVDPTGEGRYSCVEKHLAKDELSEIVSRFRLPDPPAIDVVPGPAVALRVAALPKPDKQGKVRLVVSARDAFMNRAAGFRGRVVFDTEEQVTELPEEYEFTEEDRGAHTFEGITVPEKGVFRIKAKIVDRPVEGISSPIAPDFPMPVFFGDVHCHNWIDRSPAGAAALYEHARNVAGLEFVAMSDTSPHKVANREVTRRYHEPGRFATVFAQEWADGESADHRNVYFRDDPGDEVVRAPNSMALFEKYRGRDVIVIPHTPNIDCLVGWKHADWSRHDPELQRLVEIFQIRGACEEEGPVGSGPKGGHGGSARTALARGLRIGFVGGTDSHRQTAGGPGHELHPLVESTGPMFWGQTAVLAPELTREAVFDALRDRRCYATSGARILLWFAVDGEPMGSEIASSAPLRIEVRFHAEAPVTEIAIVKNGNVWQRLTPDRLDDRIEIIDESDPVGANYYYVRLTQADGHRAWSSPVWVDHE
ncbi:MAG: DUF3604 domain-containing protein [Planctomycetes bacterium]|nr:DUF3604 domain-containing protein [Planctomycetota bacterium]